MCSSLALRDARRWRVIDLKTLCMVLWGILYHSSTGPFLSPSWLKLKAVQTCHQLVQQMHDWVKGHNRKLRTLMPFVLEELYPAVVTATTVRQREMFSQMTLAYVRFVTWDWHIRLIMSWKINCWIKTRAITGLLWRRTLKRLVTYHWLTPTCSIPIAWFRILLFKRGTVFFWYILLLLVLPKRAIITCFFMRFE